MRPGLLSGSALTRSSHSPLRRSPRTRVSPSTVRFLYSPIDQGLITVHVRCSVIRGAFVWVCLFNQSLYIFPDPLVLRPGTILHWLCSKRPSASSPYDVHHDDHAIRFPSRSYAGRVAPLSERSFISIMAYAPEPGKFAPNCRLRSDTLVGR
jgi:hypothetical protein